MGGREGETIPSLMRPTWWRFFVTKFWNGPKQWERKHIYIHVYRSSFFQAHNFLLKKGAPTHFPLRMNLPKAGELPETLRSPLLFYGLQLQPPKDRNLPRKNFCHPKKGFFTPKRINSLSNNIYYYAMYFDLGNCSKRGLSINVNSFSFAWS